MQYRIDVLRNYVPIGTLAFTGCTVNFSADAKIKRSASIVTNMAMMDLTVDSFELMSDRISPVMIDDYGREYRAGIFMLVSDPVTYGTPYDETNMELYDESYIMEQSAFDSRHFYAAGTPYTDVFSQILTECGLVRQMIDDSNSVLAIDREFPVGENILNALNTLLEEAGYESLFMDSDGFARCMLKMNKNEPDFIYRAGENSTLYESITGNTDVYGIPNVFVGVVSTPDQGVMTYTAENHHLESELSIERRGYKLTKVYKLDSASSQAELEAYVDGLLNDSLMALETLSFTSGIEPGHEFKNMLQVETEDVSGLYVEKSWSMTFGTGANMTHSAERRIII